MIFFFIFFLMAPRYFFFLIFVLVGLREASMLIFSFLGSFSGTSPGGLAGAGYFKINAKSAQLSWILG